MDKHKLFQYATLGAFTVLGLVGVIALSQGWGTKNTTTVVATSPTVIWGPPFKDSGVQELLSEDKNSNRKTGSVLDKTTYIEKNPETLYADLLEALATGKGPDAVIVDASMLLPLKDKLSLRTYQSYPLLTYQQSYVEGAEVFAQEDGIYAYPLVVDPLVLYWNRDLFTNAGIAQVPQDWETFLSVVPKLTKLQGGTDIKQSAIAFGEYENVLHAKEILSALFLQTGSKIVQYKNGKFQSDLANSNDVEQSKPEAAVRFFTDFSNPIKSVYSWNKTFERSRESFTANRVAMYAGFSSEQAIIDQINPNLNYSVAVWPQSVTGKNRVTYGKFYGIAVLKGARDQLAAHTVAMALSSALYASGWEKASGLPTVRRDSLKETPDNPFQNIAVRSALIARDWLQPDPKGIDDTLRRMVEDVVSGQKTYLSSLSSVGADINAMLARYNKK